MICSLSELSVASFNSVEAARLARNGPLRRGRYSPLSSISVAYDEAQNAFTYAVEGACELGHRMLNATDAGARWLHSHGLLEMVPHACTIVENGAPDPPPASPPPPSPKPPPLTPPATVTIETSVQFGLSSVSDLVSSRRHLQVYDRVGGATSAFAATILEWGRERRESMDLEGTFFSTKPEVDVIEGLDLAVTFTSLLNSSESQVSQYLEEAVRTALTDGVTSYNLSLSAVSTNSADSRRLSESNASNAAAPSLPL